MVLVKIGVMDRYVRDLFQVTHPGKERLGTEHHPISPWCLDVPSIFKRNRQASAGLGRGYVVKLLLPSAL